MTSLKDTAALVLSCLDLANLADDCNEAAIGAVRAQTLQAVADGADEIDMVIPWDDLLHGNAARAAVTQGGY